MGDVQTGSIRRVASTRLPTQWGIFNALAFERQLSNGSGRLETALAITLASPASDELTRVECRHEQRRRLQLFGRVWFDERDSLRRFRRIIGS